MSRRVTNDIDILEEGTRHICMWKNNKDYFWYYVSEYLRVCLDPTSMEDIDIPQCRKTVQETLRTKIKETDSIERSISSCVEGGFTNPKSKTTSNVPLIDSQIPGEKGLGPQENFEIVPALVIEDYIVRGELTISSMASSICDSILYPPKEICSNLQDFLAKAWQQKHGSLNMTMPWANGNNQGAHEGSALSAFLAAAGVIAIGLIIIYLCSLLAKRILDKSMNIHIGDEIDRNVESYIRLRRDGQNRMDTSTAIDV